MAKENSLFNETTIKRLVLDTKLTAKQKKAVSKWLDYLQNKKLENEKQAYIEFANVILKDLLNYDISLYGLKHEEANIEFLFKKDDKNLVCFEVKGAKTKDLWAYQGRDKKSRETPVNQINSYMYEQKIPFGVLTNYLTFVLFDRNEGSKKYHSIDFTELTNENKLKEFVALFSRERVEGDFISKVIRQSIIEEKEFTKEFYKLYHETRLMMLKEFEENGLSKNDSLHYAQLFLNRLMFVFFAEDKNLIPLRILEKKVIKELDSCSDNSTRVCDEIRVLFEDLDKGSTNKDLQQFNGGLFKENISRDAYFKDLMGKSFFKGIYSKKKKLEKNLKLTEEERNVFNKVKKQNLSPIVENILLMASYDFKSDLKVNILGHIFEQSLSDLEEIKDENVSKRKKEGIFYTPEYITDYICKNTIVPYLSKSGTNEVDKLIEEYSHDLEVLEEKFKKIKILDPACGSGAFLIKAVDVLFEIFEKVQKLKESYKEYEVEGWRKKKGQLTFKKFEEKDAIKEIIQNNIFGVDINEESIETTKLSLFLRIARRGKKLPDLSDNIKRGNSLIDDKEVAGDLAFDWEKEFPFKFDVVIGNPPYVLCQPSNTDEKTLKYYKDKYFSASYKIDLFHLFIERSILVSNNKGMVGLITPNTYLTNKYISRLREYILENTSIKSITLFEDEVFEDASVDTSILISSKYKKKQNKIKIQRMNGKGSLSILGNIQQIIWEDEENKTFNVKGGSNKEFSDCKKLGEIASITFGLQTKDKNKFVSTIKQGVEWENCYTGKDIGRYFLVPSSLYFKNKIKEVKAGGSWDMNIHHSKKIVVRQVGNPEPIFAYDSKGFASLNTMYNIVISEKEFDEKFVLAILNSKLIKKYWLDNFSDNKKLFPKIKGFQLKQLPIFKISLAEQKPFIEKADLMLKLNKEFYEKKNKFLKLIKHEYKIEKITKKLDKFYEFEFDDFMKQLKANLNMDKKAELLDFFEKNKKELQKLKDEIDKTDNEINQMVYKLYGLSEKEIGVVEEGE